MYVDAKDIENLPEKVRRFTDKAVARGLKVRTPSVNGQPRPTAEGVTAVLIHSLNPIDDFELWINHTAGANGGRLNLTLYTPSKKGKTTKKLTRADTFAWINEMGDALDRHFEREAAKKTEPAVTPSAARQSAVQAVKAATVPEIDASAVNAVLSTLKVNGRFALRMARTGAIPRTTTGTVRQALVDRGLVSPAGGLLTNLGKLARAAVMA